MKEIPTPIGEIIDFRNEGPIEKPIEPWQDSGKPIRPNPEGGKKE